MGHVVGEKITSAFERATEERLPVILFCCSGAVSYTHLDVYKRQAHSIFLVKNMKSVTEFCTGRLWYGASASVSYTHLDVYQRQVAGCPKDMGNNQKSVR